MSDLHVSEVEASSGVIKYDSLRVKRPLLALPYPSWMLKRDGFYSVLSAALLHGGVKDHSSDPVIGFHELNHVISWAMTIRDGARACRSSCYRLLRMTFVPFRS